VGESGCGKTTVGRSILRLIEPTAGQITFNDQNLLELEREELRRVRASLQIIFQDPFSSLDPRMNVGQIIAELALNPLAIICDEPVSALDVSIQAQVINLLAQLQEQMNLSYLFIAHDDRVAVMYLGRIVELATDKELYQNPLHPYSQALLSAVPIPDPEIRRKKLVLQGDVPSPINPPSGCSFHTRCPECKEICSRQEPPLQDAGDGHWVACHLS
jgi:oligopeptide transport system ATP-binding protein